MAVVNRSRAEELLLFVLSLELSTVVVESVLAVLVPLRMFCTSDNRSLLDELLSELDEPWWWWPPVGGGPLGGGPGGGPSVLLACWLVALFSESRKAEDSLELIEPSPLVSTVLNNCLRVSELRPFAALLDELAEAHRAVAIGVGGRKHVAVARRLLPVCQQLRRKLLRTLLIGNFGVEGGLLIAGNAAVAIGVEFFE